MSRSVSTFISTSSDCVNASTTDSYTSYSCCTDIFTERANGTVSRFGDVGLDNNAVQRVIKLHENVLEMLLNQVLLAASRTTAGGDAYVILENLYGGEGLLLSPRSYRTRHEMSKTVFKHDDRDDFNNQGERRNDNNVENCSGIDILISKSGIRVVLKEQYNLLLKESLEQNMELCLPLISFECTTTTNITFPSNDVHENCFIYDLYNKLVYHTENICRRTISIEPIIFK